MDKNELIQIKREQVKQRLQTLICRILTEQKEGVVQFEWAELFELLEWYGAPSVWKVLKKSPFKTREDFEEVASIAKLYIYGGNVLKNYAQCLERSQDVMFADYCAGIYRHKAQDYIESHFRDQNNVSIDDPDREPIAVSDGGRSWESGPSDEERIIQYFMDAMQSVRVNPFHLMLFCYSKIVPVILQLTNCDSSDTWAWQHIEGQTMQQLMDEFEQIIRCSLLRVTFKWDESHRQVLQTDFPLEGGRTVPVADVILTDAFTKNNAKNWVARVNKKVAAQMVCRLMNNHEQDLMDCVLAVSGKR